MIERHEKHGHGPGRIGNLGTNAPFCSPPAGVRDDPEPRERFGACAGSHEMRDEAAVPWLTAPERDEQVIAPSPRITAPIPAPVRILPENHP